MKTMQIKDLFQVTSGNKLDFGKMATTENGVAFVSRSSRNNGVVGYVEKIGNVSPFESGLITVSLGGTYVLSSFVQPTEFYTAQNVAVLRPLVEMSIQEKLFYCMCISANRFRYSAFGREANRTLKYLEVPTREEIPEWVSSATIPDYSHIKKSYSQCEFDINSVPHGQFRICQLFNIEYPKSLVYSNTTPQKGGINFVSSKATDNGVVGTVEKIGGVKIYPAGCITVPLKGSVLEPALQEAECYVAHQIAVLTPKNLMSTLSKLYMCTLIKANRYRFNYGRQADKTLKDLELSLPITENGDVNYSAIETYMQSLPYSNNYV
jgi:hypothetical protein